MQASGRAREREELVRTWQCMVLTAAAALLGSGVVGKALADEPGLPASLTTAMTATLTCGELMPLLHSRDKSGGGLAILWLDGYYSGRAGLPAMPAGWARTVSQGVGGTCAIGVNASRTVVDVIAQLHRDYGSPRP